MLSLEAVVVFVSSEAWLEDYEVGVKKGTAGLERDTFDDSSWDLETN